MSIEPTDKSQFIVKSNDLLMASYQLSASAHRLVLMAVVEARRNGLSDDPLPEGKSPPKITITAKSYAERFEISQDAAYKALQDAADKLLDSSVLFWSDKEKGERTGFNWVSECVYKDFEGLVVIEFTPIVFRHFSGLERLFSSYYFDHVSKLTSEYAFRLYDIAMESKHIGSTKIIDIDTFRKLLGVDDGAHKDLSNLKKCVLNIALDQINEKTDLVLVADQMKTGRRVTGFQFHISVKQTASKPIEDLKNKQMSDPQRILFSKRLAAMPAFSEKFEPGSSQEDCRSWVAEELKKPERLLQWKKSLELVGFKFSSLQTTNARIEPEAQPEEQVEFVWDEKEIAKLTASLMQDHYFFQTFSGGLDKSLFEEYLKEALTEADKRDEWKQQIKVHLPVGHPQLLAWDL